MAEAKRKARRQRGSVIEQMAELPIEIAHRGSLELGTAGFNTGGFAQVVQARAGAAVAAPSAIAAPAAAAISVAASSPGKREDEPSSPTSRFTRRQRSAARVIQAHFRGQQVREDLHWSLMGYGEQGSDDEFGY